MAGPSDIRYARNGEAYIAYQTVGQGSLDLLFAAGFPSNIEICWEEPSYRHLLRRLSTFARLILYDPRGSGLSDREWSDSAPGLQQGADDLVAVLDAVGSGRAAVLGASDGAPLALWSAARHPQRVRCLALYGGYACYRESIGSAVAALCRSEKIERDWGKGTLLRAYAPGRAHDAAFAAWWARLERQSASPGRAAALLQGQAAVDVRGLLANIDMPTLVINRKEDARVHPAAAEYLAQHIPGAKRLEIPGRDHPIFTGDVDRIADAVEEFVADTHPHFQAHRMLVALQVARIVAPHRLNATLGDRAWTERVASLGEITAQIAQRHGGNILHQPEAEVLFVRHAGPALAAQCAIELREAARPLGLRLAQGLHVGEIELRRDFVVGMTASVAVRIAERAAADEVLASTLATECAAGSGLHFASRGSLSLEGLQHPLELAALTTEQHLEPAERRPGEPDLNKLSAREREVLALVADGLSNVSIASHLHLSGHTVKRHVANILMKLELPSRAAAAALAARQTQA